MLDEFLKNELSFNREAGTYLFYGDDLEKNYRIALEFSAALFSRNIENEDEKSKIKDKTLRNLYSDLMVVDNLNIDTVRDLSLIHIYINKMKTCELFKFHTGYCDVHYC